MLKHDDLTQDVKTKAHELGRDAKDAVRAEAENAAAGLRDDAVNHAASVANAADAAGDEFAPDSLQARAAHQFADQVEGLAARLRTTDLGSVTRDVSNFARTNPAIFIGGAALLGFAATRFLKARDPHRIDYSAADGDPWRAKSAPSPTARGYDVTS